MPCACPPQRCVRVRRGGGSGVACRAGGTPCPPPSPPGLCECLQVAPLLPRRTSRTLACPAPHCTLLPLFVSLSVLLPPPPCAPPPPLPFATRAPTPTTRAHTQQQPIDSSANTRLSFDHSFPPPHPASLFLPPTMSFASTVRCVLAKMKWNVPILIYAIVQFIAFLLVLVATPIDMYRFRPQYITPNTTVVTLWGVKLGVLNTTNTISSDFLWRRCIPRRDPGW
ncbi:amastin-like_surface_protein [Leishmania braziliensis MHOM/BR/75/M2904]|uniref:Amastin-like_surface_protein n=1 Tax=Leishmania braziliensis MHOM/BR/75/M2904 TaxID=420245 RepID=A0A3P3Z4E9_LEIBR|nr:amastin-like_surface_protein [Leishmania braziliensis MHOM/BR/75/M2904]